VIFSVLFSLSALAGEFPHPPLGATMAPPPTWVRESPSSDCWNLFGGLDPSLRTWENISKFVFGNKSDLPTDRPATACIYRGQGGAVFWLVWQAEGYG